MQQLETYSGQEPSESGEPTGQVTGDRLQATGASGALGATRPVLFASFASTVVEPFKMFKDPLAMERKLLALAAILLTILLASAQKAVKPDNELPPGSPQLIQPEELVTAMQSTAGPKPIVLYVGPHTFYVQAHISGAEYLGPAGKADGMDKLRTRAKSLPRDSRIVIYCGCCPWDHCPNIRPAYQEMEKLGFSRVRVLYLPTSFGANWADKGYPIAKGE